jgi:hypothetical protein
MTVGATRSFRETHSSNSALLDELKAAHAHLMRAIDELGELTRGPLPSKEVLDKVRWKLSKASLSRRMLWSKIHCDLAPGSGEDVKSELRHLQEVDMGLLRHSTEHVARWTADRIIDDWPSYRLASEHMRAKMIEAIAAEKRILYPLLAERPPVS